MSAEKIALELQLKEEQRKFREELKKKKKELADKIKASSSANEALTSGFVSAPFNALDKTLSHLNDGIKKIDFKDGTTALLSIYRALKEILVVDIGPTGVTAKGLVPDVLNALIGGITAGFALFATSIANNTAIAKDRKSLEEFEKQPVGKAIIERIKILQKAEDDIIKGNLKKAEHRLSGKHGDMEKLVKSEEKHKIAHSAPPAPVGDFSEKLQQEVSKSPSVTAR